MSAGRYWMRLSRVLTMAVSWSAVQAARLPRPFFRLCREFCDPVTQGAR